jgi:AraC family transcriptional regulator
MEPHLHPRPHLPENVLSMTTRTRSWNSVFIETARFACAGRALHPLRHADRTRLSVVLEEVGGRCEPRLAKDQPCPVDHMPRHMAFVPADVPLWGYTADIRHVRDATLCFDIPAMEEQLGERLDPQLAAQPRPRFFDDRIWMLSKLLADACDADNASDTGTPLYGDSLAAALAALLLRTGAAEDRPVKGLAPWLLRRVIDHMKAQLPQHVELRHLAALTGLSQSHFSRAFKMSTGLAPYQWQLDARVRQAQTLLLETHACLDQIAESTGFADAAHLARTFRRLTGTTPAAWRRDRRH